MYKLLILTALALLAHEEANAHFGVDPAEVHHPSHPKK